MTALYISFYLVAFLKPPYIFLTNVCISAHRSPQPPFTLSKYYSCGFPTYLIPYIYIFNKFHAKTVLCY